MINYNNKKFRVISNSENGEVNEDLIFEYRQNGDILHCNYHGGDIMVGHLLGIVAPDGMIRMSYHQINKARQINTGICISSPEITANGKIKLHESWQWTNGDLSKGESILEEI